MRPPAQFETPRLLLRPPAPADAEALFAAYTQDPEVTRYLVWRPHRTIDETRGFIDFCRRGWEQGPEFAYLIEERASNRPLGMVSLRIDRFMASLGYVLARAAWGQGIMPEAAGALTEWALAQPAIYRVWAICDVENPASARVMEKIGMQREGLMRRAALHPNVSDEPRDCWLYARVR